MPLLQRRIERARAERDQALAMILAGEPNEAGLLIWWVDQDRELRRLLAEDNDNAGERGAVGRVSELQAPANESDLAGIG